MTKNEGFAYRVVTVSGSMKFWDDILELGTKLSMNGYLVLLPFKDPRENLSDETKKMHDNVHRQRIDMANSNFIINKDGYIGKSTMNEICYSLVRGKRVIFMENVYPGTWRDILGNIPKEQLLDVILNITTQHVQDIIIWAYKNKHDIDTKKYYYPSSEKELHKLQTELDSISFIYREKCKGEISNDEFDIRYDHIWDTMENIIHTEFERMGIKDKTIIPRKCPWCIGDLMYCTGGELLDKITEEE